MKIKMFWSFGNLRKQNRMKNLEKIDDFGIMKNIGNAKHAGNIGNKVNMRKRFLGNKEK